MNQQAAKEGQLMEREIPFDESALASIIGAEVDKQISTAKRFPRSIQKFQDEATSLVSMNENVAAECFYSLRRDDKQIMGPSSRFAEIIVYSWGNFRAGARVVSEDEEFVVSQGFAWDLEKNTAIGYEVRRRIVDSRGRRYSLDMIGVTSNAASSIALRNSVLKIVPKALWVGIYDRAIETVRGDFTTLEERRSKALTTLKAFGVEPEQVFEKLGIKGEADITIDYIVELRGYATAIKDEDTTPEELFPRRKTKEERGAGAALKEALRKDQGEHAGGIADQIRAGAKGDVLRTGAEQTDPRVVLVNAIGQLKNHSDLETMTLYADSLPEPIRGHEDFTRAFAARKAEIAAKANADAEQQRKNGGKTAGTPKMRKQYVEKMEKAKELDFLDIVFDETRGFIWGDDDARAISLAYERRKKELAP